MGSKKQGCEDCVHGTVYVHLFPNTVEYSRVQEMVISHGCGHPVSGQFWGRHLQDGNDSSKPSLPWAMQSYTGQQTCSMLSATRQTNRPQGQPESRRDLPSISF